MGFTDLWKATKQATFSNRTEGSLVPLSAGHRRVNGSIIWVANEVENFEVSGWDTYMSRYYFAFPQHAATGSQPRLAPQLFVAPYIDFAVSLGCQLTTERGLPRLVSVLMQQFHATDQQLNVAWTDPGGYHRKYFPDLELQFYTGAEDQEPPSIFGQTHEFPPAYRGQMILVVRRWPCITPAYGAQTVMPVVAVELADGIEVSNTITPFTELDDFGGNSDMCAYDPVSTELISYYTNEGTTTLRFWNGLTLVETERVELSGTFKDEYGLPSDSHDFTLGPLWGGQGGCAIDWEAGVLFCTGDYFTNSRPIVSVNIHSGALIDQFGHSRSSLDPHLDGGRVNAVPWPIHMDCRHKDGILVASSYTEWGVLLKYDSNNGNLPTTIDFDACYRLAPDGHTVNQVSLFKWDTQSALYRNLVFYCYDHYLMYYGFSYRNNEPIWGFAPGSFVGLTSDPGPCLAWNAGATYSISGFFFVGTELIVAVAHTTTSTKIVGLKFEGINSTAELIKPWEITIPVSLRTSPQSASWSDTEHGTLVVVFSNNIAVINVAEGTYDLIDLTGLEPYPDANGYVWDGVDKVVNFAAAGSMNQLKLGIYSFDPIILKDLLRWFMEKLGVGPSGYYIDPALTDEIEGVMMNSAYDMPKLFRDMGRVYNFSYFESDGVQKFVRATISETTGTAVAAATLTLDDLAPISEGDTGENECLVTELTKAQDSNANVALRYRSISAFLDYWSQSVATANPTQPAQLANSANTIEVPIFMSVGEATRRCNSANVKLLTANIKQTFRLPWRYSLLEPSDALELQIHGKSYLVVLTTVTYNADWSLSLESENFAYNELNDPGTIDDVVLPVDIPGYSDSFPIVADVPLFNPTYDVPGMITVITGVSGYGRPGWEAATMYRHLSNDTVYIGMYVARSQMNVGTVSGVFPATDAVWQTDELSEITINCLSLNAGLVESLTDLNDFHNGINCAMVGKPGRWEFIYFRDVVVVNPRVIKIKGILRGRRGTELHCNDHVAGDYFVLLSSTLLTDAAIVVDQYEVSSVGDQAMYKAIGTSSRNSNPPEATLVVEGGSLKPWAVVLHKAVLSGSDIELSWERRDRYYNSMVDGTGDVPMNEDEELYDLEIYDIMGVLVRTVTDLPSPDYVYLSADQIADGFATPPSDITIAAYQKSALIGRGFGNKVTVDVQ